MSNDRYEKIRKVLAECRDIAMEWTMRGRIPECGKFGEIAQDLDAVCAELEITDAERDHLAAALEAAREDGWQPIETAPRDGTRILAMIRWPWSDGTDGEAQDVIYWHAGGRFWVCGTPMNYVQGLDDGVEPTHWRPLPAPPAIDQARGKGEP